MKKELQAIFFDIDDTLYSTTQFTTTARRNALEAMRKVGLNMPIEPLFKELNEVINEFSSNYEYHFDKLLLRIPQKTYDGINPAILIASAVSAYHDTKFKGLKPYPEVVGVLKKLSYTRLVRGIISAGLQVKQAEKLLRLRIYRYFNPNAIFISDQIGVSKPNVKLYKRACDELGIDPKKAIYVGDNPLTDIDPPNELGMITIQSHRSGKYEGIRGRTKPSYEIKTLLDLLPILERDFGIKIK
jgi:putative hydrolase of the HAD superfamily